MGKTWDGERQATEKLAEPFSWVPFSGKTCLLWIENDTKEEPERGCKWLSATPEEHSGKISHGRQV